MPPCNKCGKPIIWNRDHYEEVGKWVPFDEETDEPHDCPENNWDSGSGSGGRGREIDGVDTIAMNNAITNLEDKMDILNKNMLKLVSAIQTVQIRIEGQMPLFPNAEPIITKQVSESIVDPGDLEDN